MEKIASCITCWLNNLSTLVVRFLHLGSNFVHMQKQFSGLLPRFSYHPLLNTENVDGEGRFQSIEGKETRTLHGSSYCQSP